MMISSSAKQGRFDGVSRGHNSAAFERAGKKCKFSASPPSLWMQEKNSCLTLPFPPFPPSKSEVRREETEWADKSKQNYLKTHIIKTHTATPVRLSTFLSCGTLPPLFPSFFRATGENKTAFDFDSSIVRSHFSTLHSTSSTRNLAVLSPPTSLAVWDQNHISHSLSVLKCTFSPL